MKHIPGTGFTDRRTRKGFWMNKKRSIALQDLIRIAMLAAVCVLATSVKIPLPTGGMVHLGTAAVFITGTLFGGVYAGWAAAIGSAFFDLLMGFSPYTIWSFVIKGAAGFAVGMIARGLWPEQDPGQNWKVRALIGMIAGLLCNLVGYIFAWWAVLGSLTVALGNSPSSLLTSGIGMAAAWLILPKLRKIIQRK